MKEAYGVEVVSAEGRKGGWKDGQPAEVEEGCCHECENFSMKARCECICGRDGEHKGCKG